MILEIKDLIEISQFYGKNKEYVIAGGGNTSFKNTENLWIKASGISLADINEDGFVCISREKLKVISERTYSNNSTEREAQVKDDLTAAVTSTNGRRPSVETSMHDVIGYPFVIHTHPTVVNSLLCSKNARELSYKLLGNEILFIEYTDPGYVLFKKVSDEIKKFHNTYGFDPKIILLENHGIFVSAGSIAEIKEIYRGIEIRLLDYFGRQLPSDQVNEIVINRLDLIKNAYSTQGKIVMKCYISPLIEEFLKNRESFIPVQTAFTPDHIVYCKSRYMFLDAITSDGIEMELSDFNSKYGFYPKIIAVKGKGLIIIGDSDKTTGIILELIENMMKIDWLTQTLGGSKPMTDTQIAFIENWEVENYRKQMVK